MNDGTVKTGMAVPKSIMKEFEELARILGYKSRSKAFSRCCAVIHCYS